MTLSPSTQDVSDLLQRTGNSAWALGASHRTYVTLQEVGKHGFNVSDQNHQPLPRISHHQIRHSLKHGQAKTSPHSPTRHVRRIRQSGPVIKEQKGLFALNAYVYIVCWTVEERSKLPLRLVLISSFIGGNQIVQFRWSPAQKEPA
jgi:hypothetical protein